MKSTREDVADCLRDRNFILSYELFCIALSYVIATAIRFRLHVPKLIRTAYFEFIFFEFVLCILLFVLRPLYFRHIKERRVFIAVYSTMEQVLIAGLSYLALYYLRHFPDYSRLMVITVFLCNAVLITCLRLAVVYANRQETDDSRGLLRRFMNSGYFMDHSMGNPITSPDTCLRLTAAFVCACFIWKAMLVPLGYFKQFAWDVEGQWPYYSVITIIAVLSLTVMLQALFGSWFAAGFLTAAALLFYTVVTVYSIRYHGTVLTTEDFHNFQTARNVIGSYRLELSEEILRVLLYGGLCLAVICVTELLCLRKFGKRGHCMPERLVRGILAFAVFFLLHGGPKPAVSRELDIWDWNNLYCKHGLLVGTVESTIANFGDIVNAPSGYTDEDVTRIAMPAQAAADSGSGQYPDIIMILNETWYDPGIYRQDLTPDVDYMENFNALPAIKGHAVVPYVGGGTNASEYELLTGNYVQLIKAYAPFNRINFTGQYSVVGYLKQLGYATMAAHPHNSSNYHRTIAWSQMGIDEMHFIDAFTDLRFYASRTSDWRITDISAFESFRRFYEAMPEDVPRFAYLLTMQNHGGWTANQDWENLVHIAYDGFQEDLRNQINEFLSCMKCTDDMIPVITEYFTDLYRRTGRRVVVYMTGDHAPSFIRDLSDKSRTSEEEDIILRSTPYFIWTNYGDEADGRMPEEQDIDLTVLTPLALRTADVPLSPYLRHTLDLNDEAVAFTNVKLKDPSGENTWSWLDRKGVFHLMNERTPAADLLRDYFYLEYNNNGSKAKQIDAWFAPAGGNP